MKRNIYHASQSSRHHTNREGVGVFCKKEDACNIQVGKSLRHSPQSMEDHVIEKSVTSLRSQNPQELDSTISMLCKVVILKVRPNH